MQKDALDPVSARGASHWTRNLAGLPAGQCAPHFLFETSKRKCAAPGGKEKMFRRVGLRRRRPPAAGGGWLALPCRSQGRKRPTLGETFGPGKFGIHPASLFAAAGPVVNGSFSSGPMRASASTTAGERVAKRNARKEKLVKCVLAPRRPPHHPPRDGSRGNRRRPKRARRQGQIGAGTDTPTPVQQLCTHVQSCDQSAFFSYTGRGAFSFWARPKREWGAHLPSHQHG